LRKLTECFTEARAADCKKDGDRSGHKGLAEGYGVRAMRIGKRHILAAASLWGGLAWVASVNVDFVLGRWAHSTGARLIRDWAFGIIVALGYVVARYYQQERRQKQLDFIDLRQTIRFIIANVLLASDEQLIRELKKAVTLIERAIDRAEKGHTINRPATADHEKGRKLKSA
jgi:hypothetical protein